MNRRLGLVILAPLALLAGALTGVVCALFRLTLESLGAWRDALALGWEGPAWRGALLFAAAAAAACAAAAALVKRLSPDANGSGIPHVEAVLVGQAAPARILLLPVKFVGGALAIGAGLALGREGPCVQMGATVAHIFGGLLRRGDAERRILLAAGAGAGVAAAFDAPLAGAVFVLEELLRRLELRSVVAALGASTSAILVSHAILGERSEFIIPHLPPPGLFVTAACLSLGVVAGLLGVVNNRLILGALDVADAVRLPAELRAGIVGACVGALAFAAPPLVGGGVGLAQDALTGAPALSILFAALALRLLLGAASYAAGTPGGLFAPLLAVGTLAGALFGRLVDPAAGASAPFYPLVAMAALFAAMVRAPLTGVILVTEMTDSSAALLPMAAACFSAMGVAALLGDAPIYDALRMRGRRPAPAAGGLTPPQPGTER
ncbi:chloride channel protein [Methylocella sp.]|uniref:chloride channel protein n=1 Tax=Methylocella sp. TaxID=1978226 RepID=UPI003783665B